MKDVPVYTLGRITTQVMFGVPTTGIEPMRDTADNVIFWERHEGAVHACAEENDKGNGWWIVVPRMVRSIRNDVET